MSFQLAPCTEPIRAVAKPFSLGILPGGISGTSGRYHTSRADVSDINQKKAARVSNRNPVDPQYTLPTSDPLPAPEQRVCLFAFVSPVCILRVPDISIFSLQFIRDSMTISDIYGSAPRSLPHHIPRPDAEAPIPGSKPRSHTKELIIHSSNVPSSHTPFTSSVAASLYDPRFPSVASTLPPSLTLQPTDPQQLSRTHAIAHAHIHGYARPAPEPAHVVGSHRLSSSKPIAGVRTRDRVPSVIEASSLPALSDAGADDAGRRRGVRRAGPEHRAVRVRVGGLLLQREAEAEAGAVKVEAEAEAEAEGRNTVSHRHGRTSAARWRGEAVAELISTDTTTNTVNANANTNTTSSHVTTTTNDPAPAPAPAGLLARLALGEALPEARATARAQARAPPSDPRPPSPRTGVRAPESCLPAGKPSSSASTSTSTSTSSSSIPTGGRAPGLIQRRYASASGPAAVEAQAEALLALVRPRWAPHEWQARTARPSTAPPRSSPPPASSASASASSAPAPAPAAPAYLGKTRLHAHARIGPGSHRTQPFRYNTDPNTKGYGDLGPSLVGGVIHGYGEREGNGSETTTTTTCDTGSSVGAGDGGNAGEERVAGPDVAVPERLRASGGRDAGWGARGGREVARGRGAVSEKFQAWVEAEAEAEAEVDGQGRVARMSGSGTRLQGESGAVAVAGRSGAGAGTSAGKGFASYCRRRGPPAHRTRPASAMARATGSQARAAGSQARAARVAKEVSAAHAMVAALPAY
jgi:hypothetical protein